MNLDHSYTFVPFEFVVPIQSETDKSHPSRSYRFSDKSLNKIKIKNPTLSAVRVLVDYKEKPFFSGLVNNGKEYRETTAKSNIHSSVVTKQEDEDDTKEETVISRNDSEQFNFVGTEQVILLKWEVLPLNTPTLLGSFKCEIETAPGGNDESEKQTQTFLNILI